MTRLRTQPAQAAHGALALRHAESADDIAAARNLMRDYAAVVAADDGVDLSFQRFDAELHTLPGAYAAPAGRLVLAWRGALPIGCIALRPLSPQRCEMKRLYVCRTARTTGAGRALVEHLITEAVTIGYDDMVLDVLPTFTAAMRLYARLGFRPTVPYCHNPVPGTQWLLRDLRAVAGAPWPS